MVEALLEPVKVEEPPQVKHRLLMEIKCVYCGGRMKLYHSAAPWNAPNYTKACALVGPWIAAHNKCSPTKRLLL